MTETIRTAVLTDARALTQALHKLSINLEDRWDVTEADIACHGFGPGRSFHAVVATRADAEGLIGAAAFSPIFSTMRGAPGLFVSDLWADESARGTGLGRRLLAAAAAEARAQWGARWLKLAVHGDNPRARAFYNRLGFTPDAGLDILVLDASRTAALGDPE